MSASHLSQHVQNPENLKGVQQERLLFDAASLIYAVMKTTGTTRKRLAELLGVTKGRITQYLCGERNLTLRTLADTLTSMNYMVRIEAEPLRIESASWDCLPSHEVTTGQSTWVVTSKPEEMDICNNSLAS